MGHFEEDLGRRLGNGFMPTDLEQACREYLRGNIGRFQPGQLLALACLCQLARMPALGEELLRALYEREQILIPGLPR